MQVRGFRWLHARLLGLAALYLLLTGCISPSFYVDATTRDVALSEFKSPAQPKPVQLLFDFQTKGAPNSRATAFLREQVVAQVKASGLFASVTDQAAAGGGVLSVVINNIPEDDAASKGFKAGLTLGASGTAVVDKYLCTVTFLPSQGKSVSGTATHAIVTTIGSTTPPQNANPAPDANEAARIMARQILANALKSLSHNPEFK